MRLPRWLRYMILACALALGGLVTAALSIYLYGQTDRATPADVIVILGASTRRDGAPSATLTRRIQHGVALFNQGFAPRILCTGGFTAGHANSEAAACAQMAESLGVPPDRILIEERSTSTEENAIEAKRLMEANGLTSALLVSDNYHLWRAEVLFRAQGLTVSSSPAQTTSGPLHWRFAVPNMFREVAATGYYAIKSIVGR